VCVAVAAAAVVQIFVFLKKIRQFRVRGVDRWRARRAGATDGSRGRRVGARRRRSDGARRAASRERTRQKIAKRL
jgi:hypothetical protein